MEKTPLFSSKPISIAVSLQAVCLLICQSPYVPSLLSYSGLCKFFKQIRKAQEILGKPQPSNHVQEVSELLLRGNKLMAKEEIVVVLATLL